MTNIEVSSLGLNYGSLQVLRDISFCVAPGEVIAFVGPSGCGKTTLLRCVSGLLPPTAGTVTMEKNQQDRPGRCSFVFQRTILLPWLTVRENLALPFKLQRKQIPQNELAAHLRSFGLEGFEDYYPTMLSVGMGQRVAFARALSEGREVLLLDEPFAGLDELTKRHLATVLVKNVRNRNLATILVTHSIHEAVFIGDRVMVLSSRPASVVGDVQVNAPRPKSEDLWFSADLLPYMDAVRWLLETNL